MRGERKLSLATVHLNTIKQSINQTNNQSINQSIYQHINQSIYQHINQSIPQPIDQPKCINSPINQLKN